MRFFPALVLSITCAGCSLPHWPVSGPVTSAYGLRFRGLNPGIHRGVDLYVPTGTPVKAMQSGVVEFAGTMRGYGTVVMLRHSPRLRTIYAHLSKINVKQGDRVEGEQVIALSGQSGDATGPHLHFEVIRWGKEDDPVPLLGGFPTR